MAALRAIGSSLKLCLVAAGEADLYPRFGRTMEWDIAAGHAVLAAAGGAVTTWPARRSATASRASRTRPSLREGRAQPDQQPSPLANDS